LILFFQEKNACPARTYINAQFAMRNAQSRVRLAEEERSIPPSEKAEKFFDNSAPLKGELSVRTEGFSRKLRPCGEDDIILTKGKSSRN